MHCTLLKVWLAFYGVVVRSGIARSEMAQKEGYQHSILNKWVEGAGIRELDSAGLEEIWTHFDEDRKGFLGQAQLERVVDECWKALENILRPQFAIIYSSRNPGCSIDQCNLEFDKRYGCLDAKGSKWMREDVFTGILDYWGIDAEGQISKVRVLLNIVFTRFKEDFVSLWNEFASDHFAQVLNLIGEMAESP